MAPSIQAAIRQKVDITLNAFQGEWFANTAFGVPYIENENVLDSELILGRVTKAFFDTSLQNKILGVEGVEEIYSYSSSHNKNTGVITVDFTLTVSSGDPLVFNTEIETT